MNDITLLLPENKAEVPLLDAVQQFYIAGDRGGRQPGALTYLNCSDPYCLERDRSRPLPVVFRWHCEEMVQDGFTLFLSERPDFENCRTIHLPTFIPAADAAATSFSPFNNGKEGRCDIRNLIPGRRYFWKVAAGTLRSAVREFRTADSPPRLIAAPDLVNVRDIGGWKNQEGKRIKYGKFFRGSAWDDMFHLTEDGKKILFCDLGIKTEIDLRGEWPEPPLPEVRRAGFRLTAYGKRDASEGIFSAAQKELVRQIFELLADDAAGAFYCHCAGGSDRTGTIAFLLEGLLGLSDEQLCTEYELTTLSGLGERSRNNVYFPTLLSGLQEYPGSNFSERSISYLHSCGLSRALEHLQYTWLE